MAKKAQIKSFTDRYDEVCQEALNFIKKNVKKGKEIRFISEDEADERVDEFYDLPIASNVSKHGYYDEYAIVSVKNVKGEILFHCVGKGDNEDVDDLSEAYLHSGSICQVADLIADELNKKSK